MKSSGKFIVVDGGEGSGKSTLLALLGERYRPQQLLVTREPGGTPLAEEIRRVILSPAARHADSNVQLWLQLAARADHLKNFIRPALAAGRHVISDRFDSSTFAYQIYGQEGSHLTNLFFKTRQMILNASEPDLYIFLDVRPEEGMRRVASRGGHPSHFDERDLAFHERVREGFLAFAKHYPHRMIDANQPLEKVRDDFFGILEEFIG